MIEPSDLMEEAAIEQMVHADLYEQDIDSAADDHAAQRRSVIVVKDNPWE